MAWVKIDDHFDEHPKIAQLGDSAFALFVCGLAYCNRNLTDGFIPSQVGLGQLRFCDGNTVPPIRELEAAGMWEKVTGGWRVHDFADYQPSKDAVLKDRQRSAERTARWRQEHRNAVSDAPGNGVTSIVSTPVTNGVSTPVSDGVSTPNCDAGPVPGPGTRYPVPGPRTQIDANASIFARRAEKKFRRRALNKSPTQEFQDELVTEFGPLLGGDACAREAIAKALNHRASRGWLNPRQGLRAWLQHDAAERATASTLGAAGRAARPVDESGWGLDAFRAFDPDV